MKKLWLAVGLMAFVSGLIILALVANPRGPREPAYHGKKLTAWLEDLDNHSPITQTNDTFAIRQIGTNGVPFLVQMLHAKDSRIKRKYMDLLERQDWVNFHFRDDYRRREDACEGLGLLGPDAKSAIPDLAKVLTDDNEEYGFMAAFTLSQIGPPALPALENALTNSNENVRRTAAAGLGELGEPSCVSNLLTALKDSDPVTRNIVAEALPRFPDQANFIVPALIANLNDPDARVRVVTAISLGRFGERAKPAAPQILKLIEENTGDKDKTDGLYWALSQIDPETAAKVNGK